MSMETSDPTHTSLQWPHILFNNFAQMCPPYFIFFNKKQGTCAVYYLFLFRYCNPLCFEHNMFKDGAIIGLELIDKHILA